MTSGDPCDQERARPGVSRLTGGPGYVRRAVTLVWRTDRRLAAWLAGLTALAGMLPVGIAYVGKLVIDTTVAAVPPGPGAAREVFEWLGLELFLVAALVGVYRGSNFCEALLRVRLAQRVVELILTKALALDLEDLEDTQVRDTLSRSLVDAPNRPLSLVRGVYANAAEALTLAGYAVLLAQFSIWLVVLLLAAAAPSILAEVRFNVDAFRLFRTQTPETRRRDYLETVLARDDFAKETRVFSTGENLLGRHREIFEGLYEQDRRMAVRRGIWGFSLAVAGALALAVCYALVAASAVRGETTIGEMAMLFVVLKQAQGLVTAMLISVAGLYEDNLYVSMLFDFLARPVRPWTGEATEGPRPGDGVRFDAVGYTYPGASAPALRDVTLHIPEGEIVVLRGPNGAGKTTLAKLAVGLLRPSSGRVLVDGRDLCDWDRAVLARRMTVSFQDFVRYQFTAGENIGMGEGSMTGDRDAWERAAERAGALALVASLSRGFDTQLGNWFPGGRELSLGQWQRIALARSFMRHEPALRVLDEPTAHLDREAERDVLASLREHRRGVATLVISHRDGVAEAADRVVVLDGGRVVDGQRRSAAADD